jgi:hypothetical protein
MTNFFDISHCPYYFQLQSLKCHFSIKIRINDNSQAVCHCNPLNSFLKDIGSNSKLKKIMKGTLSQKYSSPEKYLLRAVLSLTYSISEGDQEEDLCMSVAHSIKIHANMEAS